eukprot:gene10829-biopygen13677
MDALCPTRPEVGAAGGASPPFLSRSNAWAVAAYSVRRPAPPVQHPHFVARGAPHRDPRRPTVRLRHRQIHDEFGRGAEQFGHGPARTATAR